MSTNQADWAGESTSAPLLRKTPGRARCHVVWRPRISALLVLVLGACSDGGADPVVAGGSPFSEPKGALAIEPATVTLVEGEGISLKAKLGSTQVVASHVTWAVSPADVASVDGNGNLKGLSHGEAIVTARFASSQATSLATVLAPPKTIEAESSQFQIGIVGRTLANSVAVRALSADGTPVPGVDINFEVLSGDGALSHTERGTDADGVARVNWTLGTAAGDQRMRAWSPGLGEMSFRADALPDYDSARVVALAGEDQGGVVGTVLAEALTAQVTDQFGNALSGLAVEWTFTDGGGLFGSSAHAGDPAPALTSVADDQGVTRVLWRLGTVAGRQEAVCALLPSGGVAGAEARIAAEAAPGAVSTISVAPSTASIEVGQTQQFVFSAEDGYGNTVPSSLAQWQISDETVANLGSPGVATGLSQGSAVVTATVDGVSGSGTLSVTLPAHPVASIMVSPSTVTLKGLHQSGSLTATAYDSFDQVVSDATIEWTSLTPTVATVSQGGIVTSKGLGQALIVASAACCAVSDTVVAQVHEAVISPPPTLIQLVLTPASATLEPGGTQQFAATGVWSDGSTVTPVVSWSTTGGSITAEGIFQAGPTAGTFSVTATALDGSAGRSEVQVAEARVAQIRVSPSDMGLHIGEKARLTGSPLSEDGTALDRSVTWVSSDTSIAGVDSLGYVSALRKGNATISAFSSSAVGSANVRVLDSTLRDLASGRGFLMGTAVHLQGFRTDPQYRKTLSDEYNSLTPGNELKFEWVHPAPGQFEFSYADELVEFAERKAMAVHGHTLVWHEALPAWVSTSSFSKTELLDILKGHIETVVGHYRGRVDSWDVVNEVLQWDGSLRETIWLEVIGPEYVDSAFVWSSRADPGAKLFINETQAEDLNSKSDGLLGLASGLRERGIPVHGVGFESHFTVDSPDASDIRANFSRFAAAGFDLRVSEMDVRIADGADTSALVKQATIYREVLDACLRLSRCTDFTTWGFTDLYSWIPAYAPGFGRALPFDAAYARKRAYEAMSFRLRQR